MEKLSQGESLATLALERIRQEIISGQLSPGTVVSASLLAERFGVSRTPVRDALLQLSQAGMVRMEKNRGATILATSLEDLLEVFQIRLMLEVPLAGKAAEARSAAQLASIEACLAEMKAAQDDPDLLLALDRDLHLRIAAVAGNDRVVGMLKDLRNLVLTRGVGTTSTARTGKELVDDHLGVVEAIRDQDAQKASAEMRRHVINTAHLLIAQEANGDANYGSDWVTSRLNWL